MGGRALLSKGIKTVRLNTEEYLVIASMVEHEFRQIGWETHVVKSYRNKKSHGDVDIILKNNQDSPHMSLHNDITRIFNPTVIVKNGNVHSFDYNNFQIDAIVTYSSDWETSIGFFDYDSTGNIMGKVAHKFGLKYGHRGLVYPYRSGTSHHIKDIIISKDCREIFTFLGYDYDRYLEGFETLYDIFKYMTDTNNFDPSIFQYENLNHIDKKRNRKRKSYNEFLEYINSNGGHWNDIQWKDKILYLDHIDKFFPKANFLKQYFELKYEEKKHRIITEKFNGNLIMGMFPDITGKELGFFISLFKSQFPVFEEYVLNTNVREVRRDICNFYKKYKEDE